MRDLPETNHAPPERFTAPLNSLKFHTSPNAPTTGDRTGRPSRSTDRDTTDRDSAVFQMWPHLQAQRSCWPGTHPHRGHRMRVTEWRAYVSDIRLSVGIDDNGG